MHAPVAMNQTALDTLLLSVALYAGNDSTPPAYYTIADSTGMYVFSSVKAGVYALKAFVDLLADSLCGQYPCPEDTTRQCTEPCKEYPDSVRVEPGIKLKLEDLVVE